MSALLTFDNYAQIIQNKESWYKNTPVHQGKADDREFHCCVLH